MYLKAIIYGINVSSIRLSREIKEDCLVNIQFSGKETDVNFPKWRPGRSYTEVLRCTDNMPPFSAVTTRSKGIDAIILR